MNLDSISKSFLCWALWCSVATCCDRGLIPNFFSSYEVQKFSYIVRTRKMNIKLSNHGIKQLSETKTILICLSTSSVWLINIIHLASTKQQYMFYLILIFPKYTLHD